MGTALIQIHTDRDRECRSFATLSGSAVIQLVVTASRASPVASRDARRLYDLLLAEARRAGAQPQPTKCGGGFLPGAAGCWASSHPGPVRRGLVWVSDSQCNSPTVSHTLVPWNFVLPILPHGAPPSLLPAGLTTTAQWCGSGQIANAVPNIMIQSGLSLDAFRIFISYRRDDADAVAQQLFYGLSREHFDVYLDRFCTTPGTNFLERIRFELADKACVVVLDSRDVGQSHWVKGEYGFARSYKLGLIAVDLPGGGRTFARVGTRCDLRNAACAASFTGSTQLPAPAIDQAVNLIRTQYTAEVARRFRHQRRLIRSAAVLASAAHSLRADGHFDVSGGGSSYVVGATARPPNLESFRSVCEAARAGRPPGKAIVVGPLFAQSNTAGQDIDWLAGATGSVVVDERRVFRAMRRMAGGLL